MRTHDETRKKAACLKGRHDWFERRLAEVALFPQDVHIRTGHTVFAEQRLDSDIVMVIAEYFSQWPT